MKKRTELEKILKLPSAAVAGIGILAPGTPAQAMPYQQKQDTCVVRFVPKDPEFIFPGKYAAQSIDMACIGDNIGNPEDFFKEKNVPSNITKNMYFTPAANVEKQADGTFKVIGLPVTFTEELFYNNMKLKNGKRPLTESETVRFIQNPACAANDSVYGSRNAGGRDTTIVNVDVNVNVDVSAIAGAIDSSSARIAGSIDAVAKSIDGVSHEMKRKNDRIEGRSNRFYLGVVGEFAPDPKNLAGGILMGYELGDNDRVVPFLEMFGTVGTKYSQVVQESAGPLTFYDVNRSMLGFGIGTNLYLFNIGKADIGVHAKASGVYAPTNETSWSDANNSVPGFEEMQTQTPSVYDRRADVLGVRGDAGISLRFGKNKNNMVRAGVSGTTLEPYLDNYNNSSLHTIRKDNPNHINFNVSYIHKIGRNK